jgi:phenylpyruvate tautomerase PptA (4-oxalocrotonate tautomerase family)
MPSVRVVTGEWAAGREAELIEAVHSAMVTAIKIPDWDRDVVIDVYDRHRRIIPTGKSERYMRVDIELFSGRSLAAKRALYRAIVTNLGRLGVPEMEIKTVLIEIPPENWGLRGGLPASEIDLGFEVKV